MSSCGHEGERRGWIEIHRTDEGWAAHAYVTGKLMPEVIFLSEEDPAGVLEAASLELGGVVEAIDEIDREEAA